MDLAELGSFRFCELERNALSNLLVRLFGWPAALIHGDSTVLDRWKFLRRRLPRVRSTGERVLEVGCGTGAFAMGLAARGYEAVGLSWDERNQAVATCRAALAGVKSVSFAIGDARRLDEHAEFAGAFDAVVCCEVVEHILDDRKLFRDMLQCLKPGGRLYLTTPNYNYWPMSAADKGPFSRTEDGWHVRRGYTPAMLQELCNTVGFEVEEITYVSHVFSQLLTRLQRGLGAAVGAKLTWLLTLPLRIVPPLFDGWLGRLIGRALGWPGYSVALVAYRRRFGT